MSLQKTESELDDMQKRFVKAIKEHTLFEYILLAINIVLVIAVFVFADDLTMDKLPNNEGLVIKHLSGNFYVLGFLFLPIYFIYKFLLKKSVFFMILQTIILLVLVPYYGVLQCRDRIEIRKDAILVYKTDLMSSKIDTIPYIEDNSIYVNRRIAYKGPAYLHLYFIPTNGHIMSGYELKLECNSSWSSEKICSIINKLSKRNIANTILPFESVGSVLFDKAWDYFENGDYDKALTIFHLSAERNHPEAQYWIGICYTNGFGVAQDSKQAFEWYKKAANQGNTEAQYCVGLCYYHGDGVEVNKSKAKTWFDSAANKGYEDAKKYLELLKTEK